MLNRTGRIFNASKDISGYLYTHVRTPLMYCHPEKQSSWLPWKNVSLAQGSKFLENTNETFHPSLRYRHYCNHQEKLGANDQGPYKTKSIDGWTWPAKQPNGRIGSNEPSTSAGVFKFSRSKGKGKKETVTVRESSLGDYEKLLLAIYDQDPALRHKYDESIWKEVIGDSG